MRSMACFNLYPARLMGDSAYGSAEMLNWLVHDRGIEPHIPVFDKSKRTDGTFSREDFTYDHASDTYCCPARKALQHYRRRFTTPRTGVPNDNLIRYRAGTRDCGQCPLKPRCCPNAPARKVLRSIHEGARDLARDIAKTEAYQTSRRQRKKVYNERPWHDPYYDPLWAACEELNVAVGFHETTGSRMKATGADRFKSMGIVHISTWRDNAVGCRSGSTGWMSTMNGESPTAACNRKAQEEKHLNVLPFRRAV